jgi:hypothetical protein
MLVDVRLSRPHQNSIEGIRRDWLRPSNRDSGVTVKKQEEGGEMSETFFAAFQDHAPNAGDFITSKTIISPIITFLLGLMAKFVYDLWKERRKRKYILFTRGCGAQPGSRAFSATLDFITCR